MGKLVQYVAAHEVGHTLGFQHNMKASSMYSVAQVRDPKWVRENGHTPTLMDYSRFNYVAQPEDKISVDDLIPKIGPYDKWATMWGYKPVAGAASPQAEKKTLDEWAKQQDSKPWLRFSTEGSAGTDPGELSEAVGDQDAVAATTLGMKNLERVAAMLMSATTTTTAGEPFSDLEEVYGRVLGQWSLEMNHVAAIVGGYNSQQKHVGQTGLRFQLIPRAKQEAAVKYLVDNAFTAPKWALNPEILRRIEPVGVLDRIDASQSRVLNSLLSSGRINRLVEQETIDGAAAYAPLDFLATVRQGVFSEIHGPTATPIDAYRRNLQRAYVETLGSRVNGAQAQSDDVRAFFRGELKVLDGELSALRIANDRATRLHVEDLRQMIARALDPAVQGAGAARSTTELTEDTLFDVTAVGEVCWPDHVVGPKKKG